MSTLQAMVSTLPYPLQIRYRGSDSLGTQWLSWLNDGLVELEKEDLLPELTFESGVEVINDVWIKPPSSYRRGIELFKQTQPSIKPSIADVQDKVKIVNGMTFAQESDPATISAFSAQAADSVEIDITGYGEDQLKDYLLVITAGTLAGNTYILVGNDASGVATTKVELLHELSSAWTAPMATAGRLIHYDYYLVLKHVGFFTPMTAMTEEIPVSNKFETSLKSWLLWKANERVRNVSPDTSYHQGQWTNQLKSIRGERLKLNRSRNVRGRRLYGLEQPRNKRFSYTHESET